MIVRHTLIETERLPRSYSGGLEFPCVCGGTRGVIIQSYRVDMPLPSEKFDGGRCRRCDRLMHWGLEVHPGRLVLVVEFDG